MSVEVKTPTREQFEKVELDFSCREKNRDAVADTISPLSATFAGPGVVKDASKIKKRGSADDGQCQFREEQQGSARSHSDSEDWGDVRQRLGQSQKKFVLCTQDLSHHRPAAPRKRRFSERACGPSFGQPGQRRKSFSTRGNIKEKPRKFLLGGNISDPLNLNSLSDEAVNKALNESTPHSSPLPIPARRQQVHVLIPPNINDPLNLNSGEDIDINLISPKSGNRKKRNKHKSKKKSISDGLEVSESLLDDNLDAEEAENDFKADCAEPTQTSTVEATAERSKSDEGSTSLEDKLEHIADKIVSPVIRQTSPWKRKRTSSECRSSDASPTAPVPPKSLSIDPARSSKGDRPSPHHRFRRRSNQQQMQPLKFRGKDAKFIYGNYNRYYGYRNPEAEEDRRLQCMKHNWFEGKDVLDIGCNVGHVTLAIAKNHQPRSIVGIDIDRKLIKAAKNNVRYYMSRKLGGEKFPVSLALTRGPIAAPSLNLDREAPEFPNNVTFVQGNYVLETDELLDLQREEYDVIMGLSLTKWIHLNFGDAGIKRTFKRMFRQLRPGGKLILEPQSWASYKRKNKLTEDIFNNFKAIRLRPEQFVEYLLSKEVGFARCELIDTPFNKSKGFQRAILVFSKSVTACSTPPPQGSSSVTPMLDNDSCSTHELSSCTQTPSSRGDAPRFDIDSSGVTPCSTSKNTPVYGYSSAGGTPRGESAGDTPRGESADMGLATPKSDSCTTPRHRMFSLTSGSERSVTPCSDCGMANDSPDGTPKRELVETSAQDNPETSMASVIDGD